MGKSLIYVFSSHYLNVVEDGVLYTLVEKLADLLDLLMELGDLPCFARFIFLDGLGGWLDFGYHV